MKTNQKYQELFPGVGQCEFCLKENKAVHVIFFANRHRDICDLCEQRRSTYLRPTKETKVERIGNVRI